MSIDLNDLPLIHSDDEEGIYRLFNHDAVKCVLGRIVGASEPTTIAEAAEALCVLFDRNFAASWIDEIIYALMYATLIMQDKHEGYTATQLGTSSYAKYMDATKSLYKRP